MDIGGRDEWWREGWVDVGREGGIDGLRMEGRMEGLDDGGRNGWMDGWGNE